MSFCTYTRLSQIKFQLTKLYFSVFNAKLNSIVEDHTRTKDWEYICLLLMLAFVTPYFQDNSHDKFQ